MKVLFLSLDTLRADRLSCLGNSRGLTPNLDRLASESALFTAAYATDIPTQPSHTALFTGRYGVRTGIVSHFHPPAHLDDSIPWLPAIVRDAGCATGAVDHLFAMKDWFVRGYDDYMPPPGRSRSPGSVINDIGFGWLDKHAADDFYLFLHYWDAHIPYLPPEPFKERFAGESAKVRDPLVEQKLRSRPSYPLFKRNNYDHLRDIPNLDHLADLYDAEVAYLDFELGRLIDHLDELGILDETLIVAFGDHGEVMTEHDAWFDHAGLYDSVTHVPLMIRAPGKVPARQVTDMVELIDVMPTVLALLGLPAVDDIDGRSLVPLMNGSTQTHRTTVMLSEATWQATRAVRTEEWKYIRCYDPGVYPRSGDELYRLADDPGEQHNVASSHPEVVAELGGVLDAWLTETLQGHTDPLLEVVEHGLPAVARLDGIINGTVPPPPQAGELIDGAGAGPSDSGSYWYAGSDTGLAAAAAPAASAAGAIASADGAAGHNGRNGSKTKSRPEQKEKIAAASGNGHAPAPTNGATADVVMTNGAPSNGTSNGAPVNGSRAKRAPSNGTPANGTPANGALATSAATRVAAQRALTTTAPTNGATAKAGPANGSGPKVTGATAIPTTRPTSTSTSPTTAPGDEPPTAQQPALRTLPSATPDELEARERAKRVRTVFVALVVLAAVAVLVATINFVFLQNSVQAAGVVQPASTANLDLSANGTITAVDVQPGQTVRKNQVLATEDPSTADTNLASDKLQVADDQNKLAADQAKLTDDQSGLSGVEAPTSAATQGQLAAAVGSAQASYQAAQAEVSQTATQQAADVQAAQQKLQQDQQILRTDQATQAADIPVCDKATQPAQCSTDANRVATDQEQVNTDQASLTQAQANQAAAVSNAQQEADVAQAQVQKAEADEAAGTQGATAQQVAQAEGSISGDQAAISADQATLAADQAKVITDERAVADTVLRAPFAGVVASVNGGTGDIETAQGIRQTPQSSPITQPAPSGISIFPQAPQQPAKSQDSYAPLIILDSVATQIMAQVSETDIASIHLGETAHVSLPALAGSSFAAKVTNIDPTAVTNNGNAYFLVQLSVPTRALRGAIRGHGAQPGLTTVERLVGQTANVSF